MLTIGSLIGALSQAGVPVARQEAEELMKHYSEKGAGAGDRKVLYTRFYYILLFSRH